MASDLIPLLSDPPPYRDINSNIYPLKKKDFDQPPPYPSPHEVLGNRFHIPKGSEISFLLGKTPMSSTAEADKNFEQRWDNWPIPTDPVMCYVSGAGKTTLLNVLTSRNLTGLDVDGKVTVDGRSISRWKFKEISAFVQQNDMFIGTMTAREHLLFMARLRMGSNYTTMEQDLRVEDIIRTMGLTNCADTIIGIPNSAKGLSCGEMKRLAFASE
ncbi:unnamed protein product, partial [Strongylus vulgaris]